MTIFKELAASGINPDVLAVVKKNCRPSVKSVTRFLIAKLTPAKDTFEKRYDLLTQPSKKEWCECVKSVDSTVVLGGSNG